MYVITLLKSAHTIEHGIVRADADARVRAAEEAVRVPARHKHIGRPRNGAVRVHDCQHAQRLIGDDVVAGRESQK